MTLRLYQQAAVDQLEDGDLLVSPTGTGKTRMLCEIALREANAGGMALWVAHRLELLHQASNALREAWLTPELNVLVRSIQELRSQPPIEGVTMLIVDEAHHLPSDDWSQVRLAQYPRAKFIGATATPERGDGRGMGGVGFKRIVQTISVKSAIAGGYLVQPTVLRPAKELGPGELAQKPEQAWLDHARDLKTIVFYPNVDQAVQGACAFRDAGAIAAAVWGAMPVESRRKALEMFKNGEINVLTSVNLLTEGFDVPDVECVVLARGFGTAGGYLQAVGRALRPAVGKTRALVLDLRGCSHVHGDPDDDRTFHLEGRGIRRPVDDVDVRFCPVCGAPVIGLACEHCGHSGEMRKRPPRVLGLPLERFARVRQDDDEARAQRLAKWMKESRAKGHKDGSALHRFKGAYGDWPSRAVQKKAISILTG